MKVTIKICSGTACYVLGGADFLTFDEIFTEEELNGISLEVSNCLDFCKDESSKPPYVIINDKVYDNMSVNKLSNIVRNLLNS